jgi:hypothetical protein
MRPLLLAAAALLVSGCAARAVPTSPPRHQPGELAWADAVRAMPCPAGTDLWLLNARNIAQPAARPPEAVYQRGPEGEMYVLQCQPGYRCLVRPVAAWCQRTDGTEHGPYMEWYEDERTQRAVGGEFIDGQEHGRWTHWDRVGNVERVEVYDHGRLLRPM